MSLSQFSGSILFVVAFLLPQLGFSSQEGTPTLEQLHQKFSSRQSVSGRFVQCASQGASRLRYEGEFLYQVGSSLTLEFDRPRRKKLQIFRDGRSLQTVHGIEQKSATVNPVSAMIFSTLQLNPDRIKSDFYVEIVGDAANFEIQLTPISRLRKLMNSVSVRGSGDELRKVAVIGRDGREIVLHFLTTLPYESVPCD